MKSTIYYFSGTGNSLDIARKIGAALQPQATLVSVSQQSINAEIQEDADVVGFVFPVYMGDAPWVVKDFVKKIKFSKNPYLYAVATCNAHPRSCLPIFRGLLEACSQTLALGEIVLMPGNAKISSPETNEERLLASAERCFAIAQNVNQRIQKPVLSAKKLSARVILGSPRKKLDMAFTRFKVSSACNGCGTCRRVCPMGNIQLSLGRPVWGKACAACLGCFHWCPQKAITFRLPLLGNRPRYHHPGITLGDIAAQQPKKDG